MLQTAPESFACRHGRHAQGDQPGARVRQQDRAVGRRHRSVCMPPHTPEQPHATQHICRGGALPCRQGAGCCACCSCPWLLQRLLPTPALFPAANALQSHWYRSRSRTRPRPRSSWTRCTRWDAAVLCLRFSMPRRAAAAWPPHKGLVEDCAPRGSRLCGWGRCCSLHQSLLVRCTMWAKALWWVGFAVQCAALFNPIPLC